MRTIVYKKPESRFKIALRDTDTFEDYALQTNITDKNAFWKKRADIKSISSLQF